MRGRVQLHVKHGGLLGSRRYLEIMPLSGVSPRRSLLGAGLVSDIAPASGWLTNIAVRPQVPPFGLWVARKAGFT